MNELNKAIRYAKKSLEFEGLTVSKEQEKLVRESLKGTITHKDFIKKTLQLAQITTK